MVAYSVLKHQRIVNTSARETSDVVKPSSESHGSGRCCIGIRCYRASTRGSGSTLLVVRRVASLEVECLLR